MYTLSLTWHKMRWVAIATPPPPPRADPIPIVYDAGWAPGPIRTDTKNLAPDWVSIHGLFSAYRVAIPIGLSRPTHVVLPTEKEFQRLRTPQTNRAVNPL